MHLKETPDVPFPGVVENPPVEDVVVLADSAGVALGVQRTFSARVRSVRDDGSRLIASKCVEIPLVGRDGEISGILCRTAPRSDTRNVFSSPGPVAIESRLRVGTLVYLLLPRVADAAVGRESTYMASPGDGVVHIVNPAKPAPTS
jgi:hypothetical protein